MTTSVLPTVADLTAMSIVELTALYNSISGKAAIKKFQDKKTALVRVTPVLEAEIARRAAEATPTGKPKKTAKTPRGQSLSAQIQKLILDEKLTNEAIAERLGLKGTPKASYPAWNRSFLVRTGKIKVPA